MMTWSIEEKIGIIGLGLALLGVVAAWLVVPGFRKIIGLDENELEESKPKTRLQRRWRALSLAGIAGLLICAGLYWIKPNSEQVQDKMQSSASVSQGAQGATDQKNASAQVMSSENPAPPKPRKTAHPTQSQAAVPCALDATAIDMQAPGSFEDTTINEGPCDTAITARPGSNGYSFKRTEINRNGKAQGDKQTDQSISTTPNSPQSLGSPLPTFDPTLRKVSPEEAQVIVQKVVDKYTLPHHGDWPSQDWINQELKAEGYAIFVDRYYPPEPHPAGCNLNDVVVRGYENGGTGISSGGGMSICDGRFDPGGTVVSAGVPATTAPKKGVPSKPECNVNVVSFNPDEALEIQKATTKLVAQYSEEHGDCPKNDWLNGKLQTMGYRAFANVNCEARSIGIRVNGPNARIKDVEMEKDPCQTGIAIVGNGGGAMFDNTKISVTVNGPSSVSVGSAEMGGKPR